MSPRWVSGITRSHLVWSCSSDVVRREPAKECIMIKSPDEILERLKARFDAIFQKYLEAAETYAMSGDAEIIEKMASLRHHLENVKFSIEIVRQSKAVESEGVAAVWRGGGGGFGGGGASGGW